MNRRRVLVVDDEPDVRDLLAELFERGGYAVSTAVDGRDALRALYAVRPDLVVLDVKMPGMDGWQTLDRIREVSNVPVLMLTARSGELDKVRGLRAGADDYAAKPFGHQELLARTEALLRRAREQADVVDGYGDALITIDFAEGIVTVGGREIALTPTEFKLLATFVRHPNQLLSHEQLLELVWDDPYAVSPGAVKLYVGYLRGKLGAGADDGSPIETVRGFGYRYRPPGA